MGGWGWGGYGGVPCMHAQTHMHVCMHRHTCMLNMLNMDASTLAAICNFYTCIHVCAFVCMHAHVCAHVWRHPHAPDTPHPPTPSPEMQGAVHPRYPHPPAPHPPRAEETQIRRITITFERIEIIQFCLKIWDP